MTRVLYDKILEMTDGLTDKELRELKREINTILDMRKIKKDFEQGKIKF